MAARRVVLLASVLLAAACSEPPTPGVPITTVAAVEATELFAQFEFAHDSVSSTPTQRVYRVPGKWLGRRLVLRLGLTPDGAVRDVQLGMPSGLVRTTLSMMREPYADFVRANIAAADTTAFAPLLAQLRHDMMGAGNGEFFVRDTTDARMPLQPTPTYVAFLNGIPVAEESHGTSRVRFDNVWVGGDTSTVLTISAAANATISPISTDWALPREPDLLGSTRAELDVSTLVEAGEMVADAPRGDTVTYRRIDGADVVFSLAVRFNADQRAERLTWTAFGPGVVDAETMTRAVFKQLSSLVPHDDIVAVAGIMEAGLLATPGTDLAAFQSVTRVMAESQIGAEIALPKSAVRLARDKDRYTIDVRPAGAK